MKTRTKRSLMAVIAIMIIVASIAVMFTGCASKCDFSDLMEQLTKGVRAAYGENNIDKIDVTAKAELGVTKDKEKKPSKVYSVDFATQLDLNIDSTSRNNGIKLVVTETDNSTKDAKTKTVLGAWYRESSSTTATAQNMYVQYINPFDGNEHKLNIKVPTVKNTMIAKNAEIDGNQVTKDIQDADIIETYIGMLSILNNDKNIMKCKMSKKTGKFSVPLNKILSDETNELFGTITGLGDTLNPYLNALGVYLNLSELGDLLPNLVLDVQFNYEKNENKEYALSGVELKLSIDKKDFKIQRTIPTDTGSKEINEPTDEAIIEANITNDFRISIEASELKIGNGTLPMDTFSAGFNASEGRAINAVNFKVEGSLSIDKDINVDLAGVLGELAQTIQGLLGTTQLSLPKDNYKIIFEADVDITKIINIGFKQNVSPYIAGTEVKLVETTDGKVALMKFTTDPGQPEPLTDTELKTLASSGIEWRMNKQGYNELKTMIMNLLDMVNYLNIELVGAGNNKHQVTLGRESNAANSSLRVRTFKALGANIVGEGTPPGVGDIVGGELSVLLNTVLGFIMTEPNINDQTAAPTAVRPVTVTVGNETKEFTYYSIEFIEAFAVENSNDGTATVEPTDPNAEFKHMAKWIAPAIRALNIFIGGTSAGEGNLLKATFGPYTFQGEVSQGVMADMITLNLKEATVYSNEDGMGILIDINCKLLKVGENYHPGISAIQGILGFDEINLKLGLTNITYGGCVPKYFAK